MNSILVVSGNTEQLAIISGILGGRRCRVIARPDASSGLSIMREGGDIQAVVADYILPDMDAVNFFTSLKRINTVPPPVILLSDRVSVEDYLTSLSLGAFEFLFRPIHPPELLRIVDAAIRRRAENQSSAANISKDVRSDRFYRDSNQSSSRVLFE